MVLRQVQQARVGGRSLLLASLLLLVAALGLLSLLVGPAHLPPARLLAGLTGDDPLARTILLQLRLPRALLGLAVGALLGLAGAVLQGYLRNPLADPAVLGTGNMAALGAVVAIYFGLSATWVLALPLLAIGGALAGLVPLFLLAGRSERPLTLVLAGIALGSLGAAGIALALNLAPSPFAAMEILGWLMGSLADRSWEHVALALPPIVAGMALLAWDARALDALTLGEDAARSLGVSMRATRVRIALGVALGLGGAVAVSGSIGFVGLVVPHIVRPLTDRTPSAVLLPSALAGAVLLTAADILVRLLPGSGELKLGVVTAFVGVPLFLLQLARERRAW